MSRRWQAKDHKDWIQDVQSNDRDKKENAIFNLREMIAYSYITDQKELYQVGKAISAETSSPDIAIRQRAYGAISIVIKLLSFDLTKSFAAKRTAAQVGIRGIIVGSNELTLDAMLVIPDLADAMLKSPVHKDEHFDPIVEKLNKQLALSKGKLLNAAKAALKHIQAVRKK